MFHGICAERQRWVNCSNLRATIDILREDNKMMKKVEVYLQLYSFVNGKISIPILIYTFVSGFDVDIDVNLFWIKLDTCMDI